MKLFYLSLRVFISFSLISGSSYAAYRAWLETDYEISFFLVLIGIGIPYLLLKNVSRESIQTKK